MRGCDTNPISYTCTYYTLHTYAVLMRSCLSACVLFLYYPRHARALGLPSAAAAEAEGWRTRRSITARIRSPIKTTRREALTPTYTAHSERTTSSSRYDGADKVNVRAPSTMLTPHTQNPNHNVFEAGFRSHRARDFGTFGCKNTPGEAVSRLLANIIPGVLVNLN